MALEVPAVAAKLVAQRGLLRQGLMHLPYVSQVNDQVLRLRDNSFVSCIRVDGLNAATTPDRELDALKLAFARILAQLDPTFTIYIHRISRRVDLTASLDPLKANDFPAAVDERWRWGLGERQMRDCRLTISVVKHGRLARGFEMFRRASRLVGAGQERDLEILADTVRAMRSALGIDQTHILTASSGELLGFLGSVQTGDERPIYPSGALGVIADDVLSERVTFQRSGWKLHDGPLGDRFGEIRAIRAYGPISWVTIFDEFAMPCDYVIAQSFSPVANSAAVEKIQRQRNVMRATADAREQAGEQLAALHEGVLSQRVSLGQHHMTVALIDPDATIVRDLMSEVEGIGANAGFRLVRDSLVQKAHYFAQFPGNMATRSRVNVITNGNFADYASLHRTPLGKDRGEVPWETPVAVFPTSMGSSYRFSFHRHGDGRGEPPAGHTLILGETGSGKSLLAAFLMTQARRAGARIFAFDYRQGLEMAIRAMRGSYSVVESGLPTGLNPLQVEIDGEGVEWLTDWLTRILSPEGPLTPLQTQAILQNVRRNAEADAPLRQFHEFARLFASTDDEGGVQRLVEEWARDGRFGWVFGQSEFDSFSLDGEVMGFDLTQILDAPSQRERTAVLSYIFRRIERQLRDRTRTIVLIDEAWKAIDDPHFATVIEGWLATLRKQNAVVVMLTQTVDQLARSRIGDRVFSFFPTQILFPNGKSSAEDYAPLRLNPAEADIVTSRSLGRQFLLRDDENSVVLDGDASSLGDMLHILGGGTAGLSVAGPDFRSTPDFWRTVA